MKLFNKLRFHMVEGKRFQNYLLYAFGEIILVIVGILIALGINNWNNNDELKSANKALQKRALAQIKEDIIALENFRNEIDTLNQTYRKVLNRDYDRSKVNENGVISTILFEVLTYSSNRKLNNMVDNANLDHSEASKALIGISSNYKLHYNDIEDIEAIINKKMMDNLEEIEKSQPWYAELMTDLVCRNDCINYLLKNEEHKSRIASLRFLYFNGYGNIIDEFHEDLLTSQTTLEQLISN